MGANFRGLSYFYRFVGRKFLGLYDWKGGGGEKKVDIMWKELCFFTMLCDCINQSCFLVLNKFARRKNKCSCE